MIGTWPDWFKKKYGGEWPRNYMTFDTETTGFIRERDVIVEMGHCIVEDGKITNELNVVLDWTNHPVVPDEWLAKRIADVTFNMKDKGGYKMTVARMAAEGIKPEKVLARYRDIFLDLSDRGFLFVAHNGVFDEQMFRNNLKNFGVDTGFVLGPNQLFDTSAIERAIQLHAMRRPAAMPAEGESVRDFMARVGRLGGSAVKSNMAACVDKYGLAEKHGFLMADAHSAMFDARLVHYLMEEFRAVHDAPPERVSQVQPKDYYQPYRPPAASAGPPPARKPRQRNR